MRSGDAVLHEYGDAGNRPRLAGLDGIRGLAALFVVAHHSYLLAFPGYPANTGPWWLGWLLYGHFAVAVFIVLSGFSLAVVPARTGWRVGNVGRFAHRRAWRILPTFWPALLFSLVVAWTLVPQPGESTPTGKSVLVNGLLVQDVFHAPSPNGAFWSIAVEVQLYCAFPLLIWLTRRFGGAVAVTATVVPVVAVGLLAPRSAAVHALLRFTPQFAVLFACGIVAAGVVQRVRPPRGLLWCAAATVVPVVALIVVRGPQWTSTHLFWVDLSLSPAIALAIAGVASDRRGRLTRTLHSAPVRRLGSFSYSLYLVHAPIVVALYAEFVGPALGHGLAAFAVMVAVVIPITVIAAWGFATVFELPFTRHRSWRALRAAVSERAVLGHRRTAPGLPQVGPDSVGIPAPEG